MHFYVCFDFSVHPYMLLLHIMYIPKRSATTSDDFYQTDMKSHDSQVRENGCEGC